MQEYCIKTSNNICFGYLLELPQWGNSNKYPKHMLCEEWRVKQSLCYISFCPLGILYNNKFILMATSLATNAVVVTRVHCTLVCIMDAWSLNRKYSKIIFIKSVCVSQSGKSYLNIFSKVGSSRMVKCSAPLTLDLEGPRSYSARDCMALLSQSLSLSPLHHLDYNVKQCWKRGKPPNHHLSNCLIYLVKSALWCSFL